MKDCIFSSDIQICFSMVIGIYANGRKEKGYFCFVPCWFAVVQYERLNGYGSVISSNRHFKEGKPKMIINHTVNIWHLTLITNFWSQVFGILGWQIDSSYIKNTEKSQHEFVYFWNVLVIILKLLSDILQHYFIRQFHLYLFPSPKIL